MRELNIQTSETSSISLGCIQPGDLCCVEMNNNYDNIHDYINKKDAQQIIDHLQKVFDLNELITTTNPRPDGGIDTLTVPMSWLSSEKVK